MYRTISKGDDAAATGRFWTTEKPGGPVQAIIDFALDPKWGNRATQVIKAQIPAGTTVYEGAAAAQQGLVGGGSQVFIPRVDPRWIQK